jgi:GTPase SAR1 family protein
MCDTATIEVTEVNNKLILSSEFLLSNSAAMENPSSSRSPPPKQKPVAIITIGMAGAGKSTFVQRINSYLHTLNPPSPPYILNLDPAVTHIPFEANIDIRDTVNYQEVMKQCVLGRSCFDIGMSNEWCLSPKVQSGT